MSLHTFFKRCRFPVVNFAVVFYLRRLKGFMDFFLSVPLITFHPLILTFVQSSV